MVKKIKGVSLTAMGKHSKHHTAKHIKSMVASIKKGKTFTQSHKIAMKKVGR